MGITQSCFRIFSKEPLQNLEKPSSPGGGGGDEEFSWDKRKEINLSDYTIEDIYEGEVGKMPGEINGN